MCAEETCITDGKHASLVIYSYMCGETRMHPYIYRDMCTENIIPGETRIPTTDDTGFQGHYSDI